MDAAALSITSSGMDDPQTGGTLLPQVYAEETAAALEISERTAKRDWAYARAWLYREIARRQATTCAGGANGMALHTRKFRIKSDGLLRSHDIPAALSGCRHDNPCSLNPVFLAPKREAASSSAGRRTDRYEQQPRSAKQESHTAI
jgi:hypothetical protein